MASAIVGRSEADAFRRYLEAIERTLACFAPHAYLLHSVPSPQANAQLMTLADDVIALRDADGEPGLKLALELSYRVEALPASKGMWEGIMHETDVLLQASMRGRHTDTHAPNGHR